MSSADYKRGIYQLMEYAGLMAHVDAVGNTLMQEMSYLVCLGSGLVGQSADADNTVSGAVARTPEGPATTALWCPDTRGVDDRLPHIHHNRLDLHILIHPLLTTFTA
jgi:hypothetical protein